MEGNNSKTQWWKLSVFIDGTLDGWMLSTKYGHLAMLKKKLERKDNIKCTIEEDNS